LHVAMRSCVRLGVGEAQMHPSLNLWSRAVAALEKIVARWRHAERRRWGNGITGVAAIDDAGGGSASPLPSNVCHHDFSPSITAPMR
jgi:hypothetical protein